MKSFLDKIFVSNPTRKHWDVPIYLSFLITFWFILIPSVILFFRTAYFGYRGDCMLRYLANWGEFEYWCIYKVINEEGVGHIDQCWHEIKDMPKRVLEYIHKELKLVSKSTEKWGCLFEFVDEKWNPIKHRYDLNATIQCSVEKFLFNILPEPRLRDKIPFKLWG